MARARVQAAGRFSLRVTPGGFGTPEFGADARRLRLSGEQLVVESDRSGAPSLTSIALRGTTLRDLAAAAGVDLSRSLDVGHDTPPIGDIDASLVIDAGGVREIAAAHAAGGAALDLVAAELPAASSPTLARLWPEHFDVALDALAPARGRVNLGVSPGDRYLAEPYAYVGPWSAQRPGDDGFWNAPFGAARSLSELDGAMGIAQFLLSGFRRFDAA